jgi:hypothetical protein
MSCARLPRVVVSVGMAALLGLLALPAHAVTIDWVTGGDPGNAADTSGASDGSKYAAKTNMADKPVNFVSWFDAARVANWLQNGQGSGSTETGDYTGNWICWQHWQLCELRQWSRLEQPDRQPDDSGHQRRAESIRHV